MTLDDECVSDAPDLTTVNDECVSGAYNSTHTHTRRHVRVGVRGREEGTDVSVGCEEA